MSPTRRPSSTVLAVGCLFPLMVPGPGAGRGSPASHGAATVRPPACLDAYADSTARHRVVDAALRNGDVRLEARLYVPAGPGPFPAAVMLHGGGSDAERLRSTPDFFAPRLAACGIAALVYDKRGTGESGGVYELSTFDDFVADAGAAVAWLAGRPEVDDSRIGVVGFSQGGRLAPVVAVRYPRVSFVASVSGPLTPVEDTRYYALERSFVEAGVPDEMLARAMPLWRAHLDAVATGDTARLVALDADRAGLVGSMHPAILPPPSDSIPRTGIYNSMGGDYTTELRALRVPWLALYGGLDQQVDAERSAEMARSLMEAAGNTRLTLEVVPGVGHSFVDPIDGTRFRFEDRVVEWILQAARGDGSSPPG